MRYSHVASCKWLIIQQAFINSSQSVSHVHAFHARSRNISMSKVDLTRQDRHQITTQRQNKVVA